MHIDTRFLFVYFINRFFDKKNSVSLYSILVVGGKNDHHDWSGVP